jgi:hypothetical protein
MWTVFDKCHNLSKRNVKLILKVLSDLEALRGSSNKKTLYSTRQINYYYLIINIYEIYLLPCVVRSCRFWVMLTEIMYCREQ